MTESDSVESHKNHPKDPARGMGFSPGDIVQEFYYDVDVDEDLRHSLEEYLGSALVDEDYADVSDGAIIWWREDDGEPDDLADLLMDASGNLDDGGLVWVLTPQGTVSTQFVEEAGTTSGLRVMSSSNISPNWLGIRLLSRPSGR